MEQGPVLVTGATGRLGRDLTVRLEQQGLVVLPLVLAGYPPEPLRVPWTPSTRPIKVESERDLAGLPAPAAVVNCHWRLDRRLGFVEQLALEIDANITRLSFLWNWLRSARVQRIVNVSSIKVFSHLNAPPVTPDAAPRPASSYGVAKLAAEMFLDAFFAEASPAVIHVRLGPVLCHCGHPSQLLSGLLASAFGGGPARVVPGRTLQPVFIDDAVAHLTEMAQHGAAGCQVLAGTPVTTDELAARFQQVLGRSLAVQYAERTTHPEDPVVLAAATGPGSRAARQTPLPEMLRLAIERHQAECGAGERQDTAPEAPG
jgi:nucleoside-diphosphate-sugar epimerase